ncbi:hypothetical protein E4U60_003628 [Claviceps pazoutovae]|uniref:Required for respiratory growth protein 9, mitochondrial n=1 Tax=Claviceps pazoutovae TaxID=1649127 RepID=A0A9P7M9V6_9HYPO|nr:hypothetical protein E4U60_003628 [Claviceps pazoutovae]
MKCACSSAPWRKFLQGLVQVHNVPAVAAKPRFSTLSTACRAAPRLTTTSARMFSTAPARGQEASAAAAAVEGEISVETAATATSAANTIKTTPEETRIATKSTQNTSEQDKPTIESASTTETSATEDTFPRPRRPTETRKRGEPSATKQPYSSSSSTSPLSTESTPPTHTGTHDSSKPRSRNLSYDEDSTSTGPTAPLRDDKKPKRAKEHWQIQKEVLKEKFPDGWAPRKRLSPDALAGIRALNAQFPEVYTTKTLADKFKVSPEVIRRILKSKWAPSAEEEQDRQERWFRRGKQVWERQAAMGIKPPKKWRVEGIVRDKEWHERRKRAVKWEQEWEEKEKAMELERRARAKAREAGMAWGGGGAGRGGAVGPGPGPGAGVAGRGGGGSRS